MSWRKITDVAKRRRAALQLAGKLGRGRGQFRWLDQINPPPAAPMKPDLRNWNNRALSAVWIGHATILLRIDGITILTDPVLFNRVGIGLGLITGGPRRLVAPALSVSELPHIDLILISHAHFDHLDRRTLAQLNKKTPIITANGTSDLIRDLGFRKITELRWGDKTQFHQLAITAREVSHWGARTFIDQHRGFNAYLIESPKHRVLYAGDTAYHERFKDIGKVDLAIVGIGAYDPYIAAHANPEQAWQMAAHVQADHILPMHHSTFRLSHEPTDEPMTRLLLAADGQGHRVAIRQVGDSWTADEKGSNR